jgi:hypothetical protein
LPFGLLFESLLEDFDFGADEDLAVAVLALADFALAVDLAALAGFEDLPGIIIRPFLILFLFFHNLDAEDGIPFFQMR